MTTKKTVEIVKSQTRATWLTYWVTILSAIISIIAILWSFYVYTSAKKEGLLVQVEPSNGEYEAKMNVDSLYTYTFWKCKIVNTGNLPMNIISYEIISPPNESGVNHHEYFIDHRTERDLPLTIDAGGSKIFYIRTETELDKKAGGLLKILSANKTKLSFKDIDNYLLDRGMDIFGNPIQKYTLREDPNAVVKVIEFSKIKKQQEFTLVLRTARSVFYITGIQWYPPGRPREMSPSP